ncbi:D-TA family PLP-dependent enzyme [Dyadobacter sandarakinus]|uniref:D-TA family PLP-dependent enzyme n=1 Tax=Dyadobacter sandarakinus TaxID=2747268 RepID=A0ABX7I3K2_9BACT|nr:D-TA family PLP-dependent enzyme [Dyadobacter sandarakinus]QRR00465.1 D-TA family PLP-dependent enzyme [Dyadobacter sandarakinus]
MPWYELNHPDQVISPSLLFYKDRIEHNIRNMISLAGDAGRLVPHVKTHKCAEIVRMQMDQGISKFKCATIAEAEMLASAGARWILISYQLVGPNVGRLFQLQEQFPVTVFSSLIDNLGSAAELNAAAESKGRVATVFIDVNNGMNRTGHPTDESILSFYRSLSGFGNLSIQGLHVYDGHIRNPEFSGRKAAGDEAYEKVLPLLDLIRSDTGRETMVIAGGSPSFTVHAMRPEVYLSPGTNVLWDWGYGDRFDGQPFLHAAVVLTRVVSKPAPGIVTIDLGHKSVAAENPIENRFRLLNMPHYTVLGQSEEHGVLQVSADQWEAIKVGDVYYALPYHICPTVALHDYATIVLEGDNVDEWKITARSRRLSV